MDDEADLLQWIDYSAGDATVCIQTTRRVYNLDIGEVMEMRSLLKRMNFDQRFERSGV